MCYIEKFVKIGCNFKINKNLFQFDLDILVECYKKIKDNLEYFYNLIVSDKYCMYMCLFCIYNFWYRFRKVCCMFNIDICDMMKLVFLGFFLVFLG